MALDQDRDYSINVPAAMSAQTRPLQPSIIPSHPQFITYTDTVATHDRRPRAPGCSERFEGSERAPEGCEGCEGFEGFARGGRCV